MADGRVLAISLVLAACSGIAPRAGVAAIVQAPVLFQSVSVGSQSAEALLVLNLSALAVAPSLTSSTAEFSATIVNCSQLNACEIGIVFSPLKAGLREAHINANDSNGNLAAVVPVAGTGSAALSLIQPGTLSIPIGQGPSYYGPPTPGPGVNTSLETPQAVVIDSNGNVFVADASANVVLEYQPQSAVVAIIAGTGSYGFSGDFGPASAAQLASPSGLAIDAEGNVFIADAGNNRIRVVSAVDQTITTVAGGGSGQSGTDPLGDGALAVNAVLNSPSAVVADLTGNLYIADTFDSLVREVNASTGIIETVAGCQQGTCLGGSDGVGDGLSATSASLLYPAGIALDQNEAKLYIADTYHHMVRMVNISTGVISSVAGTANVSGYSGDGGPAAGATLNAPSAVSVDAGGNLYIADANNFVVRLVLSDTGNIQTLVGSGSGSGFSASGLSSQVSLGLPAGLAIDGDTLWVADAANLVVDKVTFNSAEVLFPTTTTNSVSSPFSFAAANAGNEPLIISSISSTSQFSVVPGGTCFTVGSVQPGGVCAFGVVFSPSQSGAQVGQVSVIDNSLNQSTSSIYSASGQSVAAGPAAVLSPTTVAFGSQALQSSASAQAIVLSNSGSASLIITGIALGGANPGDFSMTTTCTGSVAAGAACSINVTFGPTALGARTATVTVSDNAGNNAATQLVFLSGNGVPAVPTISLSQTALAFGSQNVGSTSTAQAVSLSDAGASAALNISNIAVSGADAGDFQINSSCPASLAPQVGCSISVKFVPVAIGQRSASLTITDNSGGVSGSTQTVSLTGNGVGVAVATITPNAVAFASQTVGTVSAAQAITLSNSGTASLTIGSILIGGANPASFQSSNSCGNTITPGANCTVSVIFAPVGAGSASATLTVTDNVGTQSVSLGGTGIAATPSASLSPTSLTFASQAVGTVSGAQQITLTNTGNSTLIIAGISIGGTDPSDFTVTNTCGGAVQNGSACQISVAFVPAATGQRAAVLTITDNSGGQTGASQVVALNGTAIGIAAAVLSPATGMLFGNQLVGTTSTPLTATLSNAGTASLSIGSVAVSGVGSPYFTSTNSCGSSLAPQSSCTISVTFTPGVTGVVSASLVVTDGVGIQKIGLGGTGATGSPGASLSASAINFGSVASGSTQSLSVSLTNSGSGVLSITAISLSGSPVFSESNTCGASLAVGSTCVITLTFAPTASSSYAATLSLIDSAGTSEQQVPITGSGSGGPIGTLSASSVYFSPVLSGASYPQSVTFSNTGTSSLTLSGISLSGTNSTDFNLTTTCGTTLAVGHSCMLSIVFTPGAAGVRTATLTIVDNGVDSPHAVSLSGTSSATPLQFVPMTPCRVVDTRNATGPFGGPILAAGVARSFLIPNGACGIPANAAAYLVSAAVVPTSVLGALTMWPTGLSQPLVATLTSDGRVKANSAIVVAGLSGGINVFVSQATHLVLDISGYFVAGNSAALEFFPLTPCRLVDTRQANGALGGPYLSAGVARSFPILSSTCNIPSTALAYSLNFTSVPHGPLGSLTVWPTGAAEPLASTLNAPTGVTTGNAAVVHAGTGGAIDVLASNDSDLVIDANGYFAAPSSSGLSLYTLTPCRVLDTRLSSGLFTGTLAVNVIGSSCSVPSSAQAFVFSATVVPSGGLGTLTMWPYGQPQPLVATLNAVDGVVTSNMAIVSASSGEVDAFASNPTQLVLDISSYFAP